MITKTSFRHMMMWWCSVMFIVVSMQAHALWAGCDNQSLSYAAATVELAKPVAAEQEFSLLVWNSYKGQRDAWLAAFSQLSQQADFILLQEASRQQLERWPLRNRWFRYHGVAFEWLGDALGVMNLAKQASADSCLVLSTEPWIRFPKSALLQRYRWHEHDLLLVNIHSINFTWGEQDYSQQLQQLGNWLAGYAGAMIVAGDFNTWNDARMAKLKQFAERYQLTAVSFASDQRRRFLGRPLDHIYYRGLRLERSQSIVSEASDHNALWARFSFIKHSLR